MYGSGHDHSGTIHLSIGERQPDTALDRVSGSAMNNKRSQGTLFLRRAIGIPEVKGSSVATLRAGSRMVVRMI
jgi:hypothetical protein